MSIWKNNPIFRLLFHKNKTPSKHAIHFLNYTQFLGALNDNVFKYLVVFLLIHIKGEQHTAEILFWAGSIYVLPFLLFSSASGILADHFSKQRLIITLKITEIVITLLAMISFYFSSEIGSYSLMFLLSAQSAAFGPSKYSIIPELVKEERISWANGLITSFTYLAIILGTFIASFVTQITNYNFFIASLVPIGIAVLGFLTSIFLPYTEPKKGKRKINPFFPYEIYQTLKICYKTPFLLTVIFSSAFFFFIGAFFQLNIIPYAIEALKLSEVGGGYLFLNTAIGIALGAFTAGKISKKRVEIGLTCIASFLLAGSLFLFRLSFQSLFLVILHLILVGFMGGLFVVPLDSYTQTFSPVKNRGRIIAAANFLSFCGVFLAPLLLYLLTGILKISAESGFVVIGWITLGTSIILLFKFSKELLHFVSKVAFLRKYKISSLEKIENNHQIFILHPSSLFKAILLFGIFPKIQFYLPKKNKNIFDRLLFFLGLRKILYIEKDQKPSLVYFERRIEEIKKPHEIPCLLLKEDLPLEKPQIKSLLPTKMSFVFIKIDTKNKTLDFHVRSKITFQ
ncbi:MAG: hypothetical protein Tsb0015_05030 [Simkaniaceae bacterium]